MAKMVLLDSRLFVGGADLSGSGNKIEIAEESEAKPATNWRSGGAVELLGGLSQVDISAEGQWEVGTAGSVDDAFWAQRRTLDPWTASPSDGSDTSVGELMYLTRAVRLGSKMLGQVGDVAPWSATARGTWPLVRGVSAHQSGTARTSTGDGTAVQLGAVASGQHLYANLHVLSVSGTSTPTITVAVESDDAEAFSDATERGSFAAATAVGGEAIRLAGPFTDTWWRVTWEITGTTPSFLFLVSFGIE